MPKFSRKQLQTFALQCEIKQGPMGLLNTSLSESPISCFKGISFSLHDLPWVPKGRFKQLLTRGERGTERHIQETIVQTWGRLLVHFQGIYTIISLSSSTELKPPRNENKRKGPPDPVLKPPNTSTLILICGPIFYFQTIKPLPNLSKERAQSLGH